MTTIEKDADNRIVDLHVWNVSHNHLVATVSLVTHYPKAPVHYKELLREVPALSHVIIEVNPCHGKPCLELLPDEE